MSKFLLILCLMLTPMISKAEVIQLTTFEQHAALANQGKPMIIMFKAEWCGYCADAMPAFVEADKLFDGKVVFAVIDIDTVAITGIPGVPAYMIGNSETLFIEESLNQLKSRDVKGLSEYIEHFTGVKP